MKRLLPVLMGFALLLLSSTEGWSLPPCPGSYDKTTWTDCFGTLNVTVGEWDGDKYVGEWKDGKLHGQGTYTYANGDKYVGEFRGGKPNGQGTGTFANGNKYVGEYKNGKKNGHFIATFASGDKYVGELKDDNYHGQGTLTFASGNKYVGDWKDGKYQGQGTFTFADGRVREGIWNGGEFKYAKKLSPTITAEKTTTKRSSLPPCPGSYNYRTWTGCFGTIIFSDGDKYIGEWKYGYYHGQGTETYTRGNKYVGEFKDGKKNGQGTYTYADGTPLEGIFGNNQYLYAKKPSPTVIAKKAPTKWSSLPPCKGSYNIITWTDCFGTYAYANGENYVGEFKDSKFNGQGTFTYAVGDKYVGEFKDDKPNGQGTKTFASGNKYVGEWKNDKHHGQGTFTYTDGTVMEGIWEGGLLKFAKKLSPTVTAKKSKQVRNDGRSLSFVGITKATATFRSQPTSNKRTKKTTVLINTKLTLEPVGKKKLWYKIIDICSADDVEARLCDLRNRTWKGLYVHSSVIYRTSKEDIRLCQSLFRQDDRTYKEVNKRSSKAGHLKMVECLESNKIFARLEEFLKAYQKQLGTDTTDALRQRLSENDDQFYNPYELKKYLKGLKAIVLFTQKLLESKTVRTVPIGEDKNVIANQPCPGSYKPTWNNCIGTRTFHNGSKYVGGWKKGKWHGGGTLTHADGEKYVGGFKNGLHHGNGTITHANGKTLKGIWENDKFKSAGNQSKNNLLKKPRSAIDFTGKENPLVGKGLICGFELKDGEPVWNKTRLRRKGKIVQTPKGKKVQTPSVLYFEKYKPNYFDQFDSSTKKPTNVFSIFVSSDKLPVKARKKLIGCRISVSRQFIDWDNNPSGCSTSETKTEPRNWRLDRQTLKLSQNNLPHGVNFVEPDKNGQQCHITDWPGIERFFQPRIDALKQEMKKNKL